MVQKIPTLLAHCILTHMKASKAGISLSALPSLLLLGLYYSLALHMHQSLGTWPTSIGERGFPPLLVTHANFVEYYFEILLILTIFVLPVIIIICLLVRRWQRF